MHAPELGDRLVVRCQSSQQPHPRDVSSALRLQPPRGTDLLQIAVEVQLQKIARIVTWSPGLGCFGTLKPQRRHVQPPDKRIDHAADMIFRNHFLQSNWKQASLGSSFSLHKAHEKCPRSREGIFSFIYRFTQSFVTVCKSLAFPFTCFLL